MLIAETVVGLTLNTIWEVTMAIARQTQQSEESLAVIMADRSAFLYSSPPNFDHWPTLLN
ncbi:hypothetical protein [Trichothermofontia sp.]